MTHYQVIWRGPVGKVTGLGIASTEYVLALARQGVNVKLEGINGGTPRIGRSKVLRRLARKAYTRGSRKVLIYHFTPNRIKIKQVKKKFHTLILNTVWETTRIPRNWFPAINQFDAVFVPCRQNKRALIKSGVRVPIYIVPHGVNTTQFSPKNRKLAVPKAKNRFVFVSVFGFQHRKNPEALLRAYWEEFTSKDNVLLLIKTSGYSRHETLHWIRNQIQRYRKRLRIHANTAPIVLLPRTHTASQLKGIYTLGNVFVLPTRGEGVGLPFLEALASGTPVIATGWGGHMDFLTRRNSFLIPYTLQPPATSMKRNRAISRTFRRLFAQRGQLWAEANRRSLRRLMRLTYENPKLCRRKGLQGRRDVEKLSWNRSGLTMKRAIHRTINRAITSRHSLISSRG